MEFVQRFSGPCQIQQAALEQKKLETQLQEAKKQIELQVQDIFGQVQVAQKNHPVRTGTADQRGQILPDREQKYAEGMASQIEFIDARTARTRADLNVIMTKMDFHIKVAELEKIVGLYQMDKE